jgi:hypothetical protein
VEGGVVENQNLGSADGGLVDIHARFSFKRGEAGRFDRGVTGMSNIQASYGTAAGRREQIPPNRAQGRMVSRLEKE